MKHLAKSLVVLLVVTCAWRYGRESVRAWLAHAGRAPLAPLASPLRLPREEHYSPAEDLERLDYQGIHDARRSLEIAMYSFTDRLLAQGVIDAARRGVQVRVYRDGEEYEREQARGGAYASTTAMFRSQPNIHIRVKPPSRNNLMHLKTVCIDGRLLRTGSANWSPAGERLQDNDALYAADRGAIERFERNFEVLWNRGDNIVVQ